MAVAAGHVPDGSQHAPVRHPGTGAPRPRRVARLAVDRRRSDRCLSAASSLPQLVPAGRARAPGHQRRSLRRSLDLRNRRALAAGRSGGDPVAWPEQAAQRKHNDGGGRRRAAGARAYDAGDCPRSLPDRDGSPAGRGDRRPGRCRGDRRGGPRGLGGRARGATDKGLVPPRHAGPAAAAPARDVPVHQHRGVAGGVVARPHAVVVRRHVLRGPHPRLPRRTAAGRVRAHGGRTGRDVDAGCLCGHPARTRAAPAPGRGSRARTTPAHPT